MNSWNSTVKEVYENLPLHWLIFKMDFDNKICISKPKETWQEEQTLCKAVLM